ncbi:MAG: DNRLRE domain-containing protein, partial [Bacteroidota bacterium]
MKTINIIITGVCLFLITNSFAQITKVIYTDKDASISTKYPDSNFVNSTTFYTYIRIGKTGVAERSLIEIDLSSIQQGSTIISAVLKLSGVNHIGENESYLSAIKNSWDESLVTWNNQPTYFMDLSVFLPGSTSLTEDYSVDITTICQSWVNGTLDNNGLMLRMGIVGLMGVTQLSFASSDYADPTKWPYLEITYELPTTELKAGDCGATDVLFDRILKAIQFTDADQYQFHVFNPAGFDEILTKSVSAFSLNELTGQVEYNTTYSVEVRMIFQNDTSTWGDECIITTVNLLPGQSCESAILENITYSPELKNYTVVWSDEFWLKIIPNETYFALNVIDSTLLPDNFLEGIELYSGNCGNLSLKESSDTSFLYVDSLLADSSYFIKIHFNTIVEEKFSIYLHYNKAGYIGEYNIFPSNLHWFISDCQAFNCFNPDDHAKTCVIECVSFPFLPDCMVDFYTHNCANGSNTERNFGLPISTDYGLVYTYYNPNNPVGVGWDKLIKKSVPFTFNDYGGNLISPAFDLASYFYIVNSPIFCAYSECERKHYPHTVLKHTFYIHETVDENSPIIDTLELILDHTRGNMSRYPFWDYNVDIADFPRYDIQVHPRLETNPSGHTYNSTSNSLWYNMSTLNYFPLLQNIYNVDLFEPDDFNEIFDDNYIQPPPYSLIVGEAICPVMDQGIEHTYTIDKYIDLNLINPEDKIIYNPSEVNIEYDLLFPEGYTFMTLPEPGVFPDRADIEANYSYQFYCDPKDIPYQYNDPLLQAIYNIKNGATLTIGPCVTIVDAKIIVENGGTLIYDPEKTYGNFEIDPTSTGNIQITTYSAPIYCEEDCIQPFLYQAHDIIIDSDVTWTKANLDANYGTTNGDFGISGNIVITDGNRLIVEDGVILRFYKESEIIVEAGGELILSGSSNDPVTLINACSNSWKGIVVNGDQANQKYGKFKTLYSHIENAEIGIESFEGGYVYSILSTYRNNETGAKFHPFNGNNSSKFTRCLFEYDLDPADPAFIPQAHVYLNDVGIIRFEGNVFKGFGNAPMPEVWGIGISSINADFIVEPYYITLSSPIKNKFIKLEYGIKAGSFKAVSVTVKQADFIDNFRGILLENVDFATIQLNDFKVGADYIQYPPYDPENAYWNYGLYLNECTGYDVQENNFHHGITGLFINNSGMEYNELYNNSFSSLNNLGNSAAVICLNRNSNNMAILGEVVPKGFGTGNTGLEIKCNDFTQNSYNISVIDGSIQKTQGRLPLS